MTGKKNQVMKKPKVNKVAINAQIDKKLNDLIQKEKEQGRTVTYTINEALKKYFKVK